jgi:hypothetical protein
MSDRQGRTENEQAHTKDLEREATDQPVERITQKQKMAVIGQGRILVDQYLNLFHGLAVIDKQMPVSTMMAYVENLERNTRWLRIIVEGTVK